MAQEGARPVRFQIQHALSRRSCFNERCGEVKGPWRDLHALRALQAGRQEQEQGLTQPAGCLDGKVLRVTQAMWGLHERISRQDLLEAAYI